MSGTPRIPDSLPADWADALRGFDASALNHALEVEYASGHTIYPPDDLVFEAFKRTGFRSVRAVWLGQDPYHEPEQAVGIAFAVPDFIKMPPSLRNIFKEYESDLGRPAPSSSMLLDWANAGVLLLNTALTVRAHKAASHRKLGWEPFIHAVVKAVSAKERCCAFILLGNDAQKFKDDIDASRHVIFQAAHPSPLSAYRGFFGCRLFSTVNKQLQMHGEVPIAW